MPSCCGYSGAPLFNEKGKIVGIITANHSKKQSVTYTLKHQYILDVINKLQENEDIEIKMSRNYSKKYKTRSSQILPPPPPLIIKTLLASSLFKSQEYKLAR